MDDSIRLTLRAHAKACVLLKRTATSN